MRLVAITMPAASSAMLWVWWHVSAGHARTHRLRTIVQVLAIAVGVALGYSVSLINTAALSEFNAALREVNGEADAAIEGARTGFDEQLFAYREDLDWSLRAAGFGRQILGETWVSHSGTNHQQSSRLVLQASALDDAPNRERFTRIAERAGLPRNRLELRGFNVTAVNSPSQA